MAYETRTVVSLEMSDAEARLYNAMEPGVRKDLVTQYLRIRALFKKDPQRHTAAWKNIQGLMRAHDGD